MNDGMPVEERRDTSEALPEDADAWIWDLSLVDCMPGGFVNPFKRVGVAWTFFVWTAKFTDGTRYLARLMWKETAKGNGVYTLFIPKVPGHAPAGAEYTEAVPGKRPANPSADALKWLDERLSAHKLTRHD